MPIQNLDGVGLGHSFVHHTQHPIPGHEEPPPPLTETNSGSVRDGIPSLGGPPDWISSSRMLWRVTSNAPPRPSGSLSDWGAAEMNAAKTARSARVTAIGPIFFMTCFLSFELSPDYACLDQALQFEWKKRSSQSFSVPSAPVSGNSWRIGWVSTLQGLQDLPLDTLHGGAILRGVAPQLASG